MIDSSLAIPKDCVCYVFSFLQPTELANARLVNSVWNGYASSNKLWARHLRAWGAESTGGYAAYENLRQQLLAQQYKGWGRRGPWGVAELHLIEKPVQELHPIILKNFDEGSIPLSRNVL